MPSTTRAELGAPTMAKKWYLDVNAGTHNSPTWTAVNGLNDFKPGIEPTTKDNSSYASNGWGSNVITKLQWTVTFKAWRNVDPTDSSEYDDGQEILREAADQLGQNNRVEVRWYEMEPSGPRVEAYQGYASVGWSPDGGSDEDLDSVSVTLNGQGTRNGITHPSPHS
jgi:hypothetical protein